MPRYNNNNNGAMPRNGGGGQGGGSRRCWLATVSCALPSKSLPQSPQSSPCLEETLATALSEPHRSYWHVRRLLDLGADPNHRAGPTGPSAVCIAAMAGDAHVVNLLFARGATCTDEEWRFCMTRVPHGPVRNVIERQWHNAVAMVEAAAAATNSGGGGGGGKGF